MLSRSQAASMSREAMQPGTHPKRLKPYGRERGLPLPTNVAGGKGQRAAAAKRLAKREFYA